MSESVTEAIDNRKGLPLPGEARGRVAILTANRVEDIEFFYPYYRFIEEGYSVDVFTPNGGELEAYRGMKLQETRPLAEATPADYDLLFIPGGLAPEELRENQSALAFVREYAATGKLIGSVCHGPRVLAAAGLIEGLDLTGFHQVADEIRSAGANYIDEPVVEGGQFITSRKPGDMPQELSRILTRLRSDMVV